MPIVSIDSSLAQDKSCPSARLQTRTVPRATWLQQSPVDLDDGISERGQWIPVLVPK